MRGTLCAKVYATRIEQPVILCPYKYQFKYRRKLNDSLFEKERIRKNAGTMVVSRWVRTGGGHTECIPECCNL